MPSSLSRRKGSEFHVIHWWGKALCFLKSSQYGPDYFLSCGRQTVLCRDLQRPWGNWVSHPAETQQVMGSHTLQGCGKGRSQWEQFTGQETQFPIPSLSSCLVYMELAQKIQRTSWGERDKTADLHRMSWALPLTFWPDPRFCRDWPPWAQAQQINFIHFCLCKPRKSIALKSPFCTECGLLAFLIL